MRKVGVVGLILFIALMMPVVSAGFFDPLKEGFDDFFGVDDFDEESLIIIQGLVFLLMFLLVYSAMCRARIFRDNIMIRVIVSIVISLMGAYYLSRSQAIYGILVPNTLVGMIFITILPFVFFLGLIHMLKFNMFARKLCWIVFGLVYVYLFVSRYESLTNNGKLIYYITFGLIVLAYYFDDKIKDLFGMFKK